MSKTAHEKYLAGEPLNEELAALKNGTLPSFLQAAAPVEQEFRDPTRELTRAERLDLREMVLMPGWNVMQRITKRLLQTHEASAIVHSRQDPLQNSEAIAKQWAYVEMFRRAMLELKQSVEAEIERTEKVS